MYLRQQRQNGDPRMSSNHWDIDVLDIQALGLSHKGIGSDNVEAGNTDHLLGVVDAKELQCFSGNRDGRVDGVRDDKDDSLEGGMR